MSRLRVRLVLNEGGEGAPLGQISDVGKEVERFLRYLAEDAGINVERRDWVARDFENASVRFDIEAPDTLSDDAVALFNAKFDYVDRFDPEVQTLNGAVRHQTMLQYAKAADALGPHERMSFGLYRPRANRRDKPYEYKSLSKLKAVDLQQRLTEKLVFKSTVQGRIHNIGLEEHYFNLRDRRTSRLVRCDFPAELYDEVHKASASPEALVYVRGSVSQRRVDRFVEGVKVEKVFAAPPLPDVFNKLFGTEPNYTGDLSTEDFVDQAWSDDD